MSSYHHGNLRAALVETAVELARTTGPDGVVLREVARRAGVSHNAAYRHFADRDALLAEVAALAMTRLGEAMQRRMAQAGDGTPKERSAARLRAVGRGYVDFALREPGLFRVAFAARSKGDGPAAGESAEAGEPEPYELLNQVLDEGVAAGSVAPGRRPGAEVVCWAAVHGFATLHLDGPLRDLPVEEREATLEVMLDHISRGLE